MSEMHEGHRERMRSRAQMSGLDALMPHEVVELLLYFSMPRRDVNEIAHNLIKEFGSVYGVLSASEQALLNVDGVGAGTARWLRALAPALKSYKALTLADRALLSTRARSEAYARSISVNAARNMRTRMFLLNSGGYLIYTGIMSSGAYWASADGISSVVEHALRYRAHSVVIMSHKPSGKARAGEYDMKGVDALNARLSAVGVIMQDYIQISPQNAYSTRKEAGKPCQLERFTDARVCETWLSED